MFITQNSRRSRDALRKLPGVFRDPGQNESYLSWLFLMVNSAELQLDTVLWFLSTIKRVQESSESGEDDHPGPDHAANG